MSSDTDDEVQVEALLLAARPTDLDLVDQTLSANLRAKLFSREERVQLGRLHLQRALGSGAMGSVFSAYDPTLERRVAVKVVRQGAPQQAQTPEQILREARALARLNHSNVVRVFDVVEDGDSIHIIMELIDGPNLREWAAQGQSPKDCIRVFGQAARGIAAAHRAGLVHCDIKPENLLLDGQEAKVVDFGLAQETDRGARTGGTRDYLAPECVAGQPRNEASDQYAFFVSLCECLTGERPRAASNLRTSRIPRWLRRVVKRGLRADPRQRYPSMQAVAVALDLDARQRKRHAWGLVSLAALLAMTAAAAVLLRPEEDLCAYGSAELETVWNSKRRATVQEHLSAFNTAFTTTVTERVLERIERGAQEWSASHRQICEATRVHDAQSVEVMTARMVCLAERRVELDAWLGTLESVSNEVELARVSQLEQPFEDIERCEVITHAEGDALDARLAEAYQKQLRELANIDASFGLGRYRNARTRLENLQIDVESFPQLGLQRDLLRARIESRIGSQKNAEALYRTVLREASRTGSRRAQTAAALGLLRSYALSGEPDRAIDLGDLVSAISLQSLGHAAEADALVGEAYRHADKLDEAQKFLDRSLRAQGDSGPALRGVKRALALMNRGSVALAQGHPEGAEQWLHKAHELATDELGEGHPGLGLYLDKLGRAKLARGELNAAQAYLRRALDLRAEKYGEDDRATASTRFHLGQVELRLGRHSDARPLFEQALRTRLRVYGAQDRRTLEVQRSLESLPSN